MRNQAIFFVDAFTSIPFRGNQAAVVLLEKPAPEEWMQQLASELNLAETAFLYKEKDLYNLRWFSPETEIQLCGHATLASAWILFESGKIKENESVSFTTLSGILKCKVSAKEVQMEFPALFTEKISDTAIYKEHFPNLKTVNLSKKGYLITELDNQQDILSYTPDFNSLKKLGGNVIIITAPSDNEEYDFVSRVFGPAFGINEDSVTGSAHCALAPFWGKKTGKTKLTGFQASKRTGIVNVELKDSSVTLSGRAVTVLEAELRV